MPTTIRDLIRLALPPGTVLKTDEGGKATHVRGVAGLRSTVPAFADLQSDDLALVIPGQALAIDPRLTLPYLIDRLAELPVGGIAVVGEVDDAAVELAKRRGVALLELPIDTDIRLCTREIERLLADPDTQIERRAAQLYAELTQALVTGGGVRSVVTILAAWTGQNAAIYSASGRLRTEAGQGSARAAFQLLRPTAGEHHLLGQQISVRMLGTLGGLAIGGHNLHSWDTVALEQGAAALALELSKEQAVKAAETRVRGDLLRTILSGAVVDPASLQAQAAELGFDLQVPHLACVVEPLETETGAALHTTQRLLKRRQLAAPAMARDELVIVFCPIRETDDARRLLCDLARELPLSGGISASAPAPALWPHALDEAEQALALGRQLFGQGSITLFADLGVYRLLLGQRDTPELWRFYHDTLGPLIEHDGDGGELLTTLEGYFAELGNVSKAAQRLHIHRNTLIYRLQRISDLTGIDWKHAEDQLALQVALKAHRVLRLIDSNWRGSEETQLARR